MWNDLGIVDVKPKKKPAETTVKVTGEAPLLLCNALAKKGFLKYSQVEQKDSTAIFNAMLKVIEDKVYGGIRAKRY